MTLLIGAVLVIGLTVATGYFVAQEFAYMAVDVRRLQQFSEAESPSTKAAATRALRVTRQVSFMLSGAQLGITVTALLVGFVAEPFVAGGMVELFELTDISPAISTPTALVLALVLATGVQMVLGELAPKNWAISQPERLAMALSRSTLAYLKVAGPIIRFFDNSANRLVRAMGITPVEELPQGVTSDELSHIIGTARANGQLSTELFSLLDRGLDFHQRTAAQAMMPRVDVTTIPATAMVSDVVGELHGGRSRFPVTADSVDDLVGVIGVAEILRVPPAARAHTTVGSVAAPPLLIPTGVHLPEVLDTLRQAHRQLACVVDEFGGFAGVITLEDIAEELVGEITGEDDPAEAAIVVRPDGSWLVPGSHRMDQVVDEVLLALPTNQAYETLNGLVMAHLGRIPATGDTVRLTGIRILDQPGAPTGSPANPEATGQAHTVGVILTVVAVHRRTAQTVLAQVEPDEFKVMEAAR